VKKGEISKATMVVLAHTAGINVPVEIQSRSQSGWGGVVAVWYICLAIECIALQVFTYPWYKFSIYEQSEYLRAMSTFRTQNGKYLHVGTGT